jgi:hypothetical protein
MPNIWMMATAPTEETSCSPGRQRDLEHRRLRQGEEQQQQRRPHLGSAPLAEPGDDDADEGQEQAQLPRKTRLAEHFDQAKQQAEHRKRDAEPTAGPVARRRLAAAQIAPQHQRGQQRHQWPVIVFRRGQPGVDRALDRIMEEIAGEAEAGGERDPAPRSGRTAAAWNSAAPAGMRARSTAIMHLPGQRRPAPSLR